MRTTPRSSLTSGGIWIWPLCSKKLEMMELPPLDLSTARNVRLPSPKWTDREWDYDQGGLNQHVPTESKHIGRRPTGARLGRLGWKSHRTTSNPAYDRGEISSARLPRPQYQPSPQRISWRKTAIEFQRSIAGGCYTGRKATGVVKCVFFWGTVPKYTEMCGNGLKQTGPYSTKGHHGFRQHFIRTAIYPRRNTTPLATMWPSHNRTPASYWEFLAHV